MSLTIFFSQSLQLRNSLCLPSSVEITAADVERL